MTSEEFERYLLRELLWELSQGNTVIAGLTDVRPEVVEILFHSGYERIRLRTSRNIIDAQLTWKRDEAPTITLTTE